MRNNFISFFHKAIITSLCCVILVGCGYKTAPRYIPDKVESIDINMTDDNVTEQNITLIKDSHEKI
ncbi:MAG: hypothetical protein QM493_06745 [Sulfurovum sp.]